jgi:CRISPR-associated protein Cas2
MSKRAFYLLTYDIPGDKRRTKIARLMEAVGERVQYSVFEAYLTPAELEKVLGRVGRVMDEKEDSLRIYRLCESCRGQVETRGTGQVTPPPGPAIV